MDLVNPDLVARKEKYYEKNINCNGNCGYN